MTKIRKEKLLQKLNFLKSELRKNPTPELLAFFCNRKLLKFHLGSNRKSVENMLDFSLGYKQPKPTKYGTYIRTKEDEIRMIKTIKHLHEQNRAIKQQLREDLKNAYHK
ncbi:MAG: hypothetical protein SFW07_02880 [Gammaproteobacteria bacterium]|nr:hypothetical protein [Gammaproteobacteria bacterium]